MVKIGQVEVSELNNVKGFGPNTVIKLNENGITTIQQLKKVVDDAKGEFTALTHILTGVQQKQFSNYIKEHPLIVEEA